MPKKQACQLGEHAPNIKGIRSVELQTKAELNECYGQFVNNFNSKNFERRSFTGVSEINLAPRPEASIGGPFGNLHA